MLVQKTLNGNGFKKIKDRSNTYEYKGFSFDLKPEGLDEVTVKIQVKGSYHGQPVSMWIEDMYYVLQGKQIIKRIWMDFPSV